MAPGFDRAEAARKKSDHSQPPAPPDALRFRTPSPLPAAGHVGAAVEDAAGHSAIQIGSPDRAAQRGTVGARGPVKASRVVTGAIDGRGPGAAAKRAMTTLRRWPRWVLIGLVKTYRTMLKPWLGNACRFEPTCSAYALEALGQHGALAGTVLAGGRLLRCHPWCEGGLDPVPQQPPRLFTRLLTKTGP